MKKKKTTKKSCPDPVFRIMQWLKTHATHTHTQANARLANARNFIFKVNIIRLNSHAKIKEIDKGFFHACWLRFRTRRRSNYNHKKRLIRGFNGWFVV